MGQHPQRVGQKLQHMNAATVSLEAQQMLYQLALPVDPKDTIKARRERESNSPRGVITGKGHEALVRASVQPDGPRILANKRSLSGSHRNTGNAPRGGA